MRKTNPNGRKAWILVVRILACLLLAASLAMLLLPWAGLRLDDRGQRVTLRQLVENEERRSGRSFRERVLSRLSEQEEGLYEGLLRELDPLLDDEMSPLRLTLSCTGAARWLNNYSEAVSNSAAGAETETAAWVQSVQTSASRVKMTAVYLWVLMMMLLVTGAYAIYAAAVGYGFGTVPYLVCAIPAFLGAVLAVSRANAWFQGSSRSAGLMQTAVRDFGGVANPVTVPFRLGLGAILFGVLLVLGVLLAMCSLETGARRTPEPAGPQPGRREQLPPGKPLPLNTWRCPACGTLMGDGVYCVKCGGRKPEPRLCAGCGARLEESALFCTACGKPVETRQSPDSANLQPRLQEEPRQQPVLLSTMGGASAAREPVPQTLLWSGSRREKLPVDPRIPDDSDL